MKSEAESDIEFRKPRIQDGDAIWNLVRNSPPLDLNSKYYYLIFCSHFSETSIVGVKDSEVVSFISAYIHPKKPDTLFVWQVAVGSRARGKGVGKIMLEKLVQREVCKEVVYLETTVTPSNNPSRSLFYSFSRAVDAKVEEEVFFPKEVFGEEGHEEEILIKIGPFNTLKS